MNTEHNNTLAAAQAAAKQAAADLAAAQQHLEELAQRRRELVALAEADQHARERLAALTQASAMAIIEAENARMAAEVAAEAERKHAAEVEASRQREVVKRVRAKRAELVQKTEQADAAFVAWFQKTVEAQLLVDDLGRMLKLELGVSVTTSGLVEVVLREGGRLASEQASKGREARANFSKCHGQVVHLDRQLSQSADWVHAERTAG